MKRQPDPLALLEQRIEVLRDVFGLYASDPLRELLDGDPDDPEQISQQRWISRLTMAIAGVFDASTQFFGVMVHSQDPEQDLVWVPGAIDQWMRKLERYSEIDGVRKGIRIACERGAVIQSMHEDAPLPPGAMSLERAVEVLRRRRGGIRPEPWERALW